METNNSRRWLGVALALIVFIVALAITFIVVVRVQSEAALQGSRDVSQYERAKTDEGAEQIERIQIPGIGTVDYQRLFEEVSESGESLDAFALRVGSRLRAYSDATGFEACGVLATDGQRFGIVVGSNRAHIACANFEGFRPTGMKPTGQTIHSHGRIGRVRANRNDEVLGGSLTAHFKTMGQLLDIFSNQDYATGPGYLATPKSLLHQAGPENLRVVSSPNSAYQGQGTPTWTISGGSK